MRRISFTALAALALGFLGALSARADTVLDFPLLDAPFNFSNGYTIPSMRQSVKASNDFYHFVHRELIDGWGPEKTLQAHLSIVAFDFLSEWTPLGSAWNHEEWHRAVMSVHQIDSFDDINTFPLFAQAISVSHESDADLVNLKAQFPADLVRLEEAGMEAQDEQNFELEKDSFFYGTKDYDYFVLWTNYLDNIAYLGTCAGQEADSLTTQFNGEDGANIPARDFAGLDCTAWDYDLHRPTEPYAARGVHPSGVGINRYITWSELNQGEQDYLKMQVWLSLMNFIDPNLIGIRRFKAGHDEENPTYWNFSFRHELTSFGIVTSTNFFLKKRDFNFVFIFHHYTNGTMDLPGFEIEILRKPIFIGAQSFEVSARVSAWVQPDEQLFTTNVARPGGLVGGTLYYTPDKAFEPYLEMNAKSEGWVAGDVYLEANFSVLSGFQYMF